jgi:hypothetical protein
MENLHWHVDLSMKIIRNRPFSLRREMAFYQFLAIVLTVIIVFVVTIALIKNIPMPWLELLTPILFLGFAAAVSFSYRIEWDGYSIIQKTFFGKIVNIPSDNIVSIEMEKSSLTDAVKMRRPFRRIVIYGADNRRRQCQIDISAKGFSRADIKKLLEMITSARPDLIIPNIW